MSSVTPSAESDAPSRPARVRTARVARWAAQVALAAFLGFAGWAKLTGDPRMLALFTALGLGQWLRYVTGGLEVLGAGLLLVPRLAGVGALLLTAVMAGAVAAHLFVIGGSPASPLVLGAAAATVAYVRRGTVIAPPRTRTAVAREGR